MALRPKTLSAAVVPVWVASALVVTQGLSPKLWVSVLATMSSIFIQIGTNFVNDALDFKKGADTSTRLGPKRVTQSGLLSARQVITGAALCFVVAALLGLPLVIEGGWPIIAIGITSILMGYAYTGGPYPLAYRGLGDLFVILFFGLVAVGGTYFLHTGTYHSDAFVAGLQVGFLATVLIAVNNLRDAPEDAKVKKRTLAVRFGISFARFEILSLVLLAFALGIHWELREQRWAALMPLVALPLATKIVRDVYRHAPSPIYNQFLAKSGALHLLFGILISIGFLLGSVA